MPYGVDLDTVLTGAVTWGYQQVPQLDGIVNHLQFTLGNILDIPKPPGALALIDCFGIGTPERAVGHGVTA